MTSLKLPSFIARYWARTSDVRPHPNTASRRPLTLARWGWSNESQEKAEQHAQERLNAAFERAHQQYALGQDIPQVDRREQHWGYDDGLDAAKAHKPICEEIIDVLPEGVITRNRYGALCLNTDQLAVADVDVTERDFIRPYFLWFFLGIGVCFYSAAGLWDPEGGFSAGKLLAGLIMLAAWTWLGSSVIAGVIQKLLDWGILTSSWRIVEAALTQHLQGTLHRLYRTRNGFRIIRLEEDTFEGHLAWMRSIPFVDPLYLRLCEHQQCTRVRLTPKPWRVGMAALVKPLGRWATVHSDPQQLAQRDAWVERYETQCALARKHGQYVADLLQQQDNPVISAKVMRLVELHDRYCLSPSSHRPLSTQELV